MSTDNFIEAVTEAVLFEMVDDVIGIEVQGKTITKVVSSNTMHEIYFDNEDTPSVEISNPVDV